MTLPVRFATDAEIANWDNLVVGNPDGGAMYQSESFAIAKALGGWTARHLIFNEANTPESPRVAALFIERKIPTCGLIWYSPTGPGFGSAEQLAAVVPALKSFAANHGVFLVKLETELLDSEQARKTLTAAGLIKVDNVQPISSTVMLDLTPDIDTILAEMPQKGRYAIRRAARDGVTVQEVPLTEDNMRRMYSLLGVTGDDAGFMIRTYEYYVSFWNEYANRDQGKMFFAYVDGDVVAGAYTGWMGTKAWYKDGASIRDRKAYGASHALQWHIIEWHKARGQASSYDMMGSPPSDQLKDPTHHLHGIGMFKTSLSPTVIDRTGTYDLVINPSATNRWNRFGYRIAGKLNRMFRKEVYF
jgi:lipid II:glycine glycyltransferase (peptidoglycan interpeptide bridge formation enzyme)